jgi:hypothetical protein
MAGVPLQMEGRFLLMWFSGWVFGEQFTFDVRISMYVEHNSVIHEGGLGRTVESGDSLRVTKAVNSN